MEKINGGNSFIAVIHQIVLFMPGQNEMFYDMYFIKV